VPHSAGGRTRAGRALGRAGWFVYVLRCRDGSLYTGATNDVDARLARHSAGRGARYTRSRLPVKLVHVERAAGRGAALRREAAVKRLTRAEKLALVGAVRRVQRPARPRNGTAVALSTAAAARPSRAAAVPRCLPR
jgi:putative endonuclease